ncbi:hypothetical protein E8E13_010695 [Curvularia kusanoi]|uniref:Uncharacterized protein n=1 Tax=Curvularia kusanoi TaxID=90978 RepID=A0A9P4TJG3_CURKU|nr:hypothetical protein E8E13_010695 [Curvularia kusanoi]
MGKNRRRGKRKQSTLPSHLRVALREGRQADANNSGEEMGDVIESIEERAEAFAKELSELQARGATSSDRAVSSSTSPDREDAPSSDREVSWSASPDREDAVMRQPTRENMRESDISGQDREMKSEDEGSPNPCQPPSQNLFEDSLPAIKDESSGSPSDSSEDDALVTSKTTNSRVESFAPRQ